MYTGFNGENWFEAQDEISKQWVIDAIPEGEEFTLRFRADKDDFNPDDLMKLFNLHIAFRDQGKHLNVIYCANIKVEASIPKEDIDWLINSGVNVVAVEFGNEVYAGQQANFNFEVYKSWFIPLVALISSTYPNMPMLVFLAPRPNESGVLGGRSDHSMFNNAAINYINSERNIHPVVHIYMNSRECPVLTTRPAPKVYQTEADFAEIEVFYNTLREQTNANYKLLWNNTLNYIATNLPDKDIYLTEWGFDNYGDIKNTIATGDFTWKIWTIYSRDIRIKALLQHNGLSMALPGMICPKHKTNDIPEEGNNKRRIDYWLYKLFREAKNISLITNIETPGIHYISKDLDTNGVITWDDNLKLINLEERVINGQNIYSSAGATEWMLKNSTPSNEVDKISSISGYYSIGYIKVQVDTILPINNKPVAIINGPDVVYTGTKVVLDGSQSFDEDGVIVEYAWYDNSGREVWNANTYTFYPYSSGTYSYLLIVTDGLGEKGYANKEVIVKDKIKPKPWYCKFFPWFKSCNI